MAAVTPSSISRQNLGSVNLLICKFANTTDDADTWASGLSSVIDFWTCGTEDPTTQAHVGVDVSESSGTFTFYIGEDDKAFTLYVLTNN
jgi:hypothetical protein